MTGLQIAYVTDILQALRKLQVNEKLLLGGNNQNITTDLTGSSGFINLVITAVFDFDISATIAKPLVVTLSRCHHSFVNLHNAATIMTMLAKGESRKK